jgi:hypothetical protein
MDAEGWITVALLASFNRVRTLTPDVGLVREMLVLSNQAELDGTRERVRMAGGAWAGFVLPPMQAQTQAQAGVSPGAVDEAVQAAVLANVPPVEENA